MKILADANIPLAGSIFSRLGEVEVVPASGIGPSRVRDADVLLVRSVTRVDASLLAGSAVRFVGTATIGHDHVDQAYLASREIAFAHAPGANADSVVEYVLAALLAAFAERGAQLRGKVVGVVGCGAIGSRLASRLPAFGVEVLCCDPPLACASGAEGFVSLPHLLAASDIVTVHTPLTRTGADPTYHLIGRKMIGALRPGAWLVNSSRGAVVDNAALRDALVHGRLGGAILDVWEGEPSPDLALLARCAIATPHIAGYSYDGKVQGAVMLFQALAQFLGETRLPDLDKLLSPGDLPPLAVPPDDGDETAWLDALTRQAYGVRSDDARMRALLDLPGADHAEHFQNLRATYPVRRGYKWHRLAGEPPAGYAAAVTEGLGFGSDGPAGA
jgi:erythronate-4-phosphate dehydrogenase